jgi:hypothetical protein
MTFWWADMNEPCHILDERHHEGQSAREYFARDPRGEWVHFEDLPEAAHKALWSATGVSAIHPGWERIDKIALKMRIFCASVAQRQNIFGKMCSF